MAFWDFFTGTPGQMTQAPLLTEQQQGAQNWALKNAQQGLGQAFNFQPIAEAAQNRFNQQTLPSISERFASMGAQRGSGYNQAVANAQRDLQMELAAQQQKFGLESQKNWADILGMGLKPSFENVWQEGTEAPINSLIEPALHAGAAWLTGGASIPFSAARYGAGGGDFGPLMQWFQGNKGQQQQPMQKGQAVKSAAPTPMVYGQTTQQYPYF